MVDNQDSHITRKELSSFTIPVSEVLKRLLAVTTDHEAEILKLKKFERLFWIWMIIILLFLGAAAAVKAETAFKPIVIDIVYIKNDYGLDPVDRRGFQKEMLKFLERLPVSYTITTRTALDDPKCAEQRIMTDTKDVYQSFDCYKRFKSKKPNHFTLIVAPPLLINGRESTGGVANGICERNSIAIVYANSINSEGLSRRGESALTAAHETGHGSGCEHTAEDNYFSVMHPAALAYYFNKLRFIAASKADAAFCVSWVWQHPFVKALTTFHKVEMLQW